MNFGGLGVAEYKVHRLWVDTMVATMNVDRQEATGAGTTTTRRAGVLIHGRLLRVFRPMGLPVFLFLHAGRLQSLKPQHPVDLGFPFSRTMDYER